MTESDEEPYPPPGVDLSHPSVARMYDYYLGGEANWEIDRQLADQVLAAYPVVKPITRANRFFLHRVVRHLIKLGVRQFVDIGSGVPTMGHAHEIADSVAPGEAHVVYVDYEPVAVAHSRALLRDHGDESRHAVIHADLRDPDRLWAKITKTGIIDPTQPVALLLIAVLHIQQPPAEGSATGDDLGPSVVARYRDLLPPGSYLAISHATDDGVPPEFAEMLAKLKKLYDTSSSPVLWRTRGEVADLFGEFAMIEPGVTWTPLWHPEDAGEGDSPVLPADPSESVILAGVGRKG